MGILVTLTVVHQLLASHQLLVPCVHVNPRVALKCWFSMRINKPHKVCFRNLLNKSLNSWVRQFLIFDETNIIIPKMSQLWGDSPKGYRKAGSFRPSPMMS